MPRRTYVIVTIGLLTTRFAAAQQLSPRLQNKEFAIESVALMPVQVEVSRSGMKGAEGMPEAASQLTIMLQDIIQAELRARKVRVSLATKPGEEQDEASRQVITDTQKKYDGLYTQLMKKPKDITKGRFTLGDSVAEFHPVEPAQILVFVRAVGTVPTSGKKLLAIAVAAAAGGMAGSSVMGPNAFVANISFVDAKTGEVLALSSIITTGAAATKTVNKESKILDKSVDKNLAKLVAKSMKKLPVAGAKKV